MNWLKILAVVLSFTFLVFVVYEKQKIWDKPIVGQFNLKFEKEYPIKRITVIDSSSFGVLTETCLYYFKIDAHVVDEAKKDIAELFNRADKLGIIVQKAERHIGGNIYVEIIVYQGGSKFKLTSWLKEKGLVYAN